MTTPPLSEMFRRLLKAEGQTRTARSVECFGWLDLVLGVVILMAPYWVASVLYLPALTVQGANYLRLAGLLVSGLGMLYIVSGRLNSQGFAFASLLDRPLVPVVMAVLWSQGIIPGPLAVAFSVADFGGFLWTLLAWRADVRHGHGTARPGLVTRAIAGFFGFVSGVVRNSRTFHPDGRVFLGTVRSLQPEDASLARAAEELTGAVLLRMGMGVMKRGWPRWLADLVPDAPSIAARFHSPAAGEIPLQLRPGQDLDLLCTAGGDRLWKLVINLATGGRKYGLQQFDYFRNVYYADVPYRIDDGKLDVWIRFVPDPAASHLEPGSPEDGAEREEGLSRAVASHAVVRIEAQRTGDSREPFVPFAEIRFEEEIEVDQEALHFDPFEGRGFVPHGVLTDVRRSVYPSSVRSRPASSEERVRRENESAPKRLTRFLHQPSPSPVLAEGSPTMSTPAAPAAPAHGKRRWGKIVLLAILAVAVVFGLYLAVRFTTDRPVVYPSDYAGEIEHFKYGSLGGERTLGIPYWLWIALPELFPEYLPDKTPGRGYSSFGLIYEADRNPRYDLPIGVSRRNVQGIDRVFLNCAACHTSTVRKAPGAQPLVVVGMPANTFDTGAWAYFLASVARDEKFTPERLLDQVRAMEDSPDRLVNKPDLINRLLLRFYAIYVMREQMLSLLPRAEGLIDFRIWGPGRNDTFGADKVFFRFPPNQDPRESNGMADFPSVWYQGPRQKAKMGLHWDGNNDEVAERNLNAAYAAGVIPPAGDFESIQRTARWLETARPPVSFTDLFPVDAALAAQGKPVYQGYCAGCHGTREPPFTGKYVGKVTPIAAIGTDRHRLDSYTWQLSVNLATNYAGYEKDWGFDEDYPRRFLRYRKTQGYANTPLDGLWLRAPYLHNGSVPNLRELLEPAAARTPVFCRGSDVYDPVNVGFVSPQPDENNSCGGGLFHFDTTVLHNGNGNGGHEGPAYGTDLPAEQKRALLEYLKTF